ncbi:MAG: HD domain-containing protein [Alphaproteobacteria bacterium]
MTCPTKEQAQILLLKKYIGGDNVKALFHFFNIAEAAEKIAEKSGLNPEKAYVLGLLHDYGYEASHPTQPDFHPRQGYLQMLEMGYIDVARVCLSHTFPNKDLSTNNFPQDFLDWVEKELKNIEYDDYDRLIQLCDMFFNDNNKFSINSRVEDIATRHKISKQQQETMLNNAIYLKNYFDNKCGCDVYKLLGIKP